MVAGSRLVAPFGIATIASFTAPTGMTERADVAVMSGSLKVATSVADESVGPGDTGRREATASKSAVSIGQRLVLVPATPWVWPTQQGRAPVSTGVSSAGPLSQD